MNSLTRIDRQRGLTLVEIMVALVISLFLLAGLLQMFIGTRQSSRVQENLSRVQETGRFAIDFIGRIVRLAGYRSRTSIEEGKSFEDKFTQKAIEEKIVNGTNTLTVDFEGESAGQGDIRNCLNEQINDNFIASNILSIANNGLQCQAKTLTAAGVIVLGSDQTQPIVENVENIQILYGENTDGDVFGVADRYVPYNNVGSWDRVVSLRISVLIRTQENNLVAAPQPYSFNGATTTPTDRRLRRVFTTTITLRNRA